MLSRCFLDCSVGVWVFVTGLSRISSFFSFFLVPIGATFAINRGLSLRFTCLHL